MDKIYALYQEDEDGYLNYFYAGRSSNPSIRFKWHLSDATGSEKSLLIQYCIKKGIKIGCTIIREATTPDAESIAYWDLHNAGHKLLNQINCNENRSSDHFHVAVKPITTISLAVLKIAKNWHKHVLEPKKKVLVKNGWRLTKASYPAGNYVEIFGGDFDFAIFDESFKWQHTYITLELIIAELIATGMQPVIPKITYKNK